MTARRSSSTSTSPSAAPTRCWLGDPDAPSCVLVVEVRRETDRRKQSTWPLYVAGLRARDRCPVLLVIVAPSATVAAWRAEPIDLGHARCRRGAVSLTRR